MPYYIEISSWNLLESFVTESISPFSFYSERNFGNNLSRYLSGEKERTDWLILSEKDLGGDYAICVDDTLIDCKALTPVKGLKTVYTYPKSIYYRKGFVQFRFGTIELRESLIAESTILLEVKCLEKYSSSFYVRENDSIERKGISKLGNPFSFDKNSFINYDNRYNKTKGAVVGYVRGIYTSSNKDNQILQTELRNLKNSFGGFNTQMFSDVLQQRLMGLMGIGAAYDINDIVGYKPEKAWNYEVGGHYESANQRFKADVALFYIDCRDRQMTIFPDGTTTGRIMTNAGKTRSLGAEASMSINFTDGVGMNLSDGYCDARFVRYNDGKADYKDSLLKRSTPTTLKVVATGHRASPSTPISKARARFTGTRPTPCANHSMPCLAAASHLPASITRSSYGDKTSPARATTRSTLSPSATSSCSADVEECWEQH